MASRRIGLAEKKPCRHARDLEAGGKTSDCTTDSDSQNMVILEAVTLGRIDVLDLHLFCVIFQGTDKNLFSLYPIYTKIETLHIS